MNFRQSARPTRALAFFSLLFFVLSFSFLCSIPHANAATVIFLTSGTSWTVPSDWNSSNNTIEVIGAGGGTALTGYPFGGGGGGAYSKVSNISLTPGASVTYQVGAGGSTSGGNGGNTYFCNSTSNCASISGTAVTVGVTGGAGATTATGGAGGAGGPVYVASTTYAGGTGGSAEIANYGGGGGGGAAGPNGHGGHGGNGMSGTILGSVGGGGGGGAGGGGSGTGGFNGSNGSTTSGGGSPGGAGGNNSAGTGGAAASAPDVAANNGSSGGGASGSASFNGPESGGSGGAGNDWATGKGAGGGGGGAGWGGGGMAGNYGGGAGGGGASPTAGTAGAQGLIVITYSPPTITLTASTTVTGSVSVTGALAKGSGSFVIDDPLNPQNKLLYHSFVESPDAMNIYDGVATLDDSGSVTISLPDYFLPLNQDFRYLAEPIGQPMPNLHLSEGVHKEFFFGFVGPAVFSISGGAPGGEISWQITGIRHDPWILQHPIIPEVEKGPGQLVGQNQYLFPQFYAPTQQ